MKTFSSSKSGDQLFPVNSTSRSVGEMNASFDPLTDHLVLISMLILAVIFVGSMSIYFLFNFDRLRKRRQFNLAVSQTRAAYSQSRNESVDQRKFASGNRAKQKSITIEVEPRAKEQMSNDCSERTVLPSTYRTFDQSFDRSVSSQSGLSASSNRQSSTSRIKFETIKSKLKNRSGDSDLVNLELFERDERESIDPSDQDDQIDSTPNESRFGQIVESFRIDFFYKVFYSIDEKELFFQFIRLKHFQPLVERNFPSFLCKVRLFTEHGKKKNKKYLSRANPLDEIFKFNLDQSTLEQSYLKVHLIGLTNNDKQFELAQLVLILNHHRHLIGVSKLGQSNDLTDTEEHKKTVTIDQDRIDMIIQKQIDCEEQSRALVCLVYESDRCLLQVGLIKLLGIKSLIQLTNKNLNHRDLLQVKISTSIDGKILEKSKSKSISIDRTVPTSNAFFHLDYLSLHKTSVSISFHYRKSSIRSASKLIAKIDFGSTQLKNQQTFQHWTDTLSNPNRPHIQWHTLSFIESI